MPVIPSDVAFTHSAVHRWHARQSIPSPPTPPSSILLSSSLGSICLRNVVRAASSTHVAPPRVVQAPPGAQRGPIITEILAGGVAGAVVRQEQESTGPVPAYPRDPPSTDNPPSQATTTNRLPSPDDNNRRSRSPLDAGVTGEDAPPRTITIHRDAGSASQDDEDPADELPPPYSSIGLP
ncbi:hypothetical protein L210DRAFT_3539958 [Boletus edulis BED1]|uniref:Uncharacterized protein n=1 Tax=Boletus edulis BED1 TaxID=1328754 RepID=A0AAD4GE88_BOLED|nr:hypothetical protein L210DRAFT_3539958 [Boletus edulis BED1]